MSAGDRRGWLYPAALVLLALLYLPQLAMGKATLFNSALGETLLLHATAVAKLLFLVLATVHAYRSVRFFETGNPVRPAWILLGSGLGLYAVGQACLAFYQVVLTVPTPFPSVADLFFVPSMLVLAASLLSFLFAYQRVGYLATLRREAAATGIVAVLALVAAFWVILRPIATATSPPLEKLLDLAYPLLDSLVLVVALILARVTSRMRGGALARVWLLLLLGFLGVAAGDILFAYFTLLSFAALDPLLHFLFAAGYVLWAWGTRTQHRLLGA